MDFSIVNLYRPDSAYWRSFDDVRYPLMNILTKIGYSVQMLHNRFDNQSVNIIFGLAAVKNFPLHTIPANSILYNLEQMVKGSKALSPHYIESLCKFSVWDYSQRNIDILKRNFDINDIHYIPIGYVPQMECIDKNYPQDIDVLFYGAMNSRRQKIIDALSKKNINVVAIERVFGDERNFLIARSKIILNVHYYTPGIFEEVRASYALANKKAVVSERNVDTFVPQELDDACLYVPYESVVENIIQLLKNPTKREEQAERGYHCIVRRPYESFIREAAIKAVPRPSNEHTPPAYLNAGSGKDFKDEYLNVDINRKWNPDIILDLSEPIIFEQVFSTFRFGNISLMKNHFEEIIANDILEHVSDAVTTITNFLTLLKIGGRLSMKMPYDLSCGAWQDPTHVRAFNEMSLRYFTDWSWYIGWRDYRFNIETLEYTLSDFGKTLYSHKKNNDEILRTPRAIDYMVVTLKKCVTTDNQKLDFDFRHRTFYKNKN